MDYRIAPAYASLGAGRSSARTLLDRKFKELAIRVQCAASVPYTPDRDDAVGDALPRYAIQVSRGDPFPSLRLRRRIRKKSDARCGRIDVDLTARGNGPIALGVIFHSSPDGAFEDPSSPGQV